MPLAGALSAFFSPAVIDGLFYFLERADEYDRKKRYDDNTKKLIVQAVRLYEKGDLSKEALKAIIDLLPETRQVEAKPTNVSDLLEQLLNNP